MEATAKVSGELTYFLSKYPNEQFKVFVKTMNSRFDDHHAEFFCTGRHVNAPNWVTFGHIVTLTAKELNQIAQFPYVLELGLVHPMAIPPAPKVYAQTNVTLDDTMQVIGFPSIWGDPNFDGGAGGNVRVLLGHPDTGVDYEHGGEEPFRDNILGGNPPFVNNPQVSRIIGRYDLFPGDLPFHPHGTWTAQIIARSAYKDGTYKGACYRAQIYDARVLDSLGQGDDYTVFDGMAACARANVDAINLSLGGPHSNTIDTAVENCWNQGIVVCAASGNGGHWPPDCDGTINSPADANNAIAAGAASVPVQDPDLKGQEFVQKWVSRGKRQDGSPVPFFVVAPGLYLSPGYGDAPNSGTSFASPHVTATVLALIHYLKRTQPAMSKTQRANLVRDTLMKTGLSLGYDTSGNHTPEGAYCIQGHGRIQAGAAYLYLSGGNPPPPPPTGRKMGPLQKTFTIPVAGTPPPPPPPPTGSEQGIMTILLDKSQYAPNSPVQVMVNLSFQSDGAPAPNRQLSVAFQNQGKQAVTDAKGNATVALIAPEATADGAVSFAGD